MKISKTKFHSVEYLLVEDVVPQEVIDKYIDVIDSFHITVPYSWGLIYGIGVELRLSNLCIYHENGFVIIYKTDKIGDKWLKNDLENNYFYDS